LSDSKFLPQKFLYLYFYILQLNFKAQKS